MTIKLSDAEKIRILNTSDLYPIMQKILLREEKIDLDREHFWVIGLASDNRIKLIELVSLGTIKGTLVEPMEVFSLALQKRAVKIILCHNHPSGSLNPSEADLDITDRLYQVGKIVGCPVLDHFIITTTSYLSFADRGLMETIAESTKYVPAFALKKKWEDAATEIAKRDEKIEIAKELKRLRQPPELIAQATGLSIEDIKKLRVRYKPLEEE